MTLNQNHSQNGGVLIDNCESVLRRCTNVEISFSDVTKKTELLKGTKKGTVYLTLYRMVFVSSNAKDSLGSMMFPYYLMKGCSIEQPVFSANYIRGTVSAEPGGGWEGKASFKMSFPSGGAIELGQHLFKLATNASRAPTVLNGAPSFGYPSPGAMTGNAPRPDPYNYSYAQVPSAPEANMGYPCPATSAGMFPSAPVYMPPPPPYAGPPLSWTAPSPGNFMSMDSAGSAYYYPSNPHNVYMPMEQPPPYSPSALHPEKKYD